MVEKREIQRQFVRILEARLAEPPNFMQIVLGPRQVGKTTGVMQLIKHSGCPHHYVSADEVLSPDAGWLQSQWAKARIQAQPALLVIDEIQKVPDWSRVVKGLWDADKRLHQLMHVVLLGSSSLALHQGLSESLAGRFELIQVSHWSFAECHQAFGLTLDQFLEFGGYPGPLSLLPDVGRWQQYMQASIIQPVVSQDILAVSKIQKPALLKQLFELLMLNPAQVVSYQKLLGQLQDKGNAATIKHYAELLQQAYLVSLLPKYAPRGLLQKTSSPKFVPMANALIRGIAGQSLENAQWRGRLFEAAVLADWIAKGLKVFYWSEGHAEVDAVIEISGQPLALEIKSGKNQQSQGLKAFQKRFPGIACGVLDEDWVVELLMSDEPQSMLSRLL